MGERTERTPWEQHASASGLPRFIYKPVSPAHSLKGFLITCAFDREKSATKEAMSILSKYLGSHSIHKAAENEVCAEGKQPLPRGTCMAVSLFYLRNGTCVLGIYALNVSCMDVGNCISDATVGETADGSTINDISAKNLHPIESDELQQPTCAVSLKRTRTTFENSVSDDENGIFCLKVAQKGIISISWESSNPNDPVMVLSRILADLETGMLAYPRWCQRMVPVQESFVYSRESLSVAVIKLVQKYLGEPLPSEQQRLKYAISFNRRGFKAKEVDGSKKALEVDGSKKALEVEGFDKMSCIHLVTAAVAGAAPHAVVDLGAPQMVVIVEVIPLAGVQSSPICGVAVLSGTLMNTKPRLSVKVLAPAVAQRAKR